MKESCRMGKQIYPTTATHSLAYAKAVLLVLIACVSLHLPHAAIAARLNTDGLPTHTGRQWTAPQVKESLKKLRNYKDYPSRLHQSLMVLIVAGEITVKASQPLFDRRLTDHVL
jgi:hypothetical protein